MRHPLQHLRGNAIRDLRGQGLQVDVFGEDLQSKLIEVPFSPAFLYVVLLILCPSLELLKKILSSISLC